MTNPLPLKNEFILNQGAMLGGLQVALLLLLYWADSLFGSGWVGLAWPIYMGFIYWSTMRFRDLHLDGFISFGQSFFYGVKVSALSGIIIGFFYFVLLKFVNPSLADVLIAEAQEAYLQMGFSESKVAEMEEAIRMVANPWVMMFSGILNGIFYGAIVSLAVSFFVKRKGDPFQQAMKNV